MFGHVTDNVSGNVSEFICIIPSDFPIVNPFLGNSPVLTNHTLAFFTVCTTKKTIVRRTRYKKTSACGGGPPVLSFSLRKPPICPFQNRLVVPMQLPGTGAITASGAPQAYTKPQEQLIYSSARGCAHSIFQSLSNKKMLSNVPQIFLNCGFPQSKATLRFLLGERLSFARARPGGLLRSPCERLL